MLHFATIALAAAFTVPSWEPRWDGNFVVEGWCVAPAGNSYRGTLRIEERANHSFYTLTWRTDEGTSVGSAISVQGQFVVEFRRPHGRNGLMGASFGSGGIYAQWALRGSSIRCHEIWRPAT